MQALSLRQASRCETAKTKACTCRCGGALHGKNRSGDDLLACDAIAEREFFEQLPLDDPHHVRSVEEKKRRARIKRAAAKKPNQERLWPALEDENVAR